MTECDNIVYVCSYCYKNCTSRQNCILCDICESWLHLKCSKLSLTQFEYFGACDLPFFCQKCISLSLPFVNITKHNFTSLFSVGSTSQKFRVYKYPCSKCLKPCKSNQNSILCDIRNRWTHQRCSLLSDSEFSLISNHDSMSYFCLNCYSDIFPFQSLSNQELKYLEDNVLFPVSSHNLISVQTNSSLQHKQYLDISNVKLVHNKSFTVLYINIRSLNNNFDKLEYLIDNMKIKPDIIGVSETWLTCDRPFTKALAGYNFIHEVSPSNSGGVGFFILDCHIFKSAKDFNLNVYDCEDMWIKVNISMNKFLVIGVIYRHPDYNFNNFQDSLADCIKKLNCLSFSFVIGGDVNIDLLKNSTSSVNYLDLLLSLGSFQTVNVATRFSKNFSRSSLLDHVYTNLSINEVTTNVLLYDISDHLPILTSLKKIKPPRYDKGNFLIQDMKSFDCNNFLADLDIKLTHFSINTSFDSNCDPNSIWNNFEKLFNETVYHHAPLKKLTRKEKRYIKKPWLTKGISKSIQTKNFMFQVCIKQKSNNFSKSFKKYRNLLTRVIALSKKLYFQKEVKSSSGNSKKLWRTINNIVSYKSPKCNRIDHIENDDGVMTRDPNEICNKLNDNFVSLANSLMVKNNVSSSIPPSQNFSGQSFHTGSFFINPFTSFGMLRLIKNMDINKCCRSDTPKIKFLVLSADLIAPFITKIFNLCISTGIFPESLKMAEVVPIFKSGSRANVNNYRPISLLSPFAKIFEAHLYEQLLQYFNKNDFFYKFQYGFREKSSTELAVTQIVDDTINVIESRSIQCSVFLDLAKAFNTVNHTILLNKLEKYGIRGLPLMLIRSFLQDRLQCTNANCTKSNWKFVRDGVPQGSSLGPLFFLIYINDFPNCTNLRVTLYADDACLTYDHHDPLQLENVINSELKNVKNWLNSNKLFVNHAKSNFLIFTKKRIKHKFSILLNSTEIKQAHHTKYLGVIINDKLDWKDHVSFLKSKLSKSSYIIWKLKHFVDKATLKCVYYSLVYSHLHYCISSWGSASPSNLNSLVTLQKRIIRTISCQPARSHTNPLFLDLGILKLNDIYKLEVAKLMFRQGKNCIINNSICPVNLVSHHSHHTRLASNDNFFLSQPRTNLGLRSFSYVGPKIWQCVPTEFKDKTKAFSSFKYKYRKYLISLYQLKQ